MFFLFNLPSFYTGSLSNSTMHMHVHSPSRFTLLCMHAWNAPAGGKEALKLSSGGRAQRMTIERHGTKKLLLVPCYWIMQSFSIILVLMYSES
jgi:hypothetical protein